jgi:CRISPR-associated protein Cmr1
LSFGAASKGVGFQGDTFEAERLYVGSDRLALTARRVVVTKLVFTLETVTPLFLGGAQQEAELRPASIRGALRYWLRAAVAGVIGDKRLDTLREREASVFGDTERGSATVVRVLDHPFGGSVKELAQQGVGYLWFSLKGRGAGDRQAFLPPTSFRVLLQQRGNNALPLNHAAEAVWLLSQFGSLGARSRRGAGSIRIKQVEGWPDSVPTPIVKALTPTELQSELAAGLQQVRQNVSSWVGSAPPSLLAKTEFDLLHPDACGVWVLDRSFDRWQDALEAVGIAMQAFRVRFPRADYPGVPDDYANVKAALQGGDLNQPVQRAVFGLPIVFYFTSLQGQRDTLEGDDHDRRSSPLIIRVTQLANGKFAVVFTVFYAKLLPDGERLKLKKSKAKVRVPDDWTAMELFLDHLDNAVAPLLEVNYR